MSIDVEFVRLRDEFRTSIKWRQPALTREAFFTWARSKDRDPPLRANDHYWAKLKNGRPVPRKMVEYLCDYLRARQLYRGELSIAAISEPVEVVDEAESPTMFNIWTTGWVKLLGFMTRALRTPEETFCRTPADFLEAATTIAEWVGGVTDNTLRGNAAVALGEKVMGRTVKQQAVFLKTCCKVSPYAVLFPTAVVGSKRVRIGVNVVLPLTESAFQQFARGELEDIDVRAEHLTCPSKFHLLNAVADKFPDDERLAKAPRQTAQMTTLLFQFAKMMPLLLIPGVKPSFVSFAGTPESKRRLEAFDYVPTGAKTPRSGKEVMAYGQGSPVKNGGGRWESVRHYWISRTMIVLCQSRFWDPKEFELYDN